MAQISIHSVTDLITNSSTVIYTYSDGCQKALEEFLDELFLSMGMNVKCSDVFVMMVTPNFNTCAEWIDENEGRVNDPGLLAELASYKTRRPTIDKLIGDIAKGAIEKPEWFDDMCKPVENSMGYPGETVLNVFAKDPKHDKLADLAVNFLYSTNHESCYNG